KRVYPSWAPSRQGISEKWAGPILTLDNLLFQPANENKLVDQALHQADVLAPLLRLRDYVVRCQSIVERAGRYELKQSFKVELVSGHSQNDCGLGAGVYAHGTRVANGTVESNFVYSEAAPA